MKNTAYKIESASIWGQSLESGVYKGSTVDLKDGFIHLSTRKQVLQTFAKYFADQRDLLLIEVDLNALGDTVKWEKSRGGDLFPHIYGVMPIAAVVEINEINYNIDNKAIFPAKIYQTDFES